jgi:hypothetical protein
MPLTSIAICFQHLLAQLHLTPTQGHRFAQHEEAISTRLETAFNTKRVEVIGSYCRDSVIRFRPDMDLLLVLRVQDLKWGDGWKSSTTILNQVRGELRGRFPSTVLGKDGQAITIRFEGGARVVDIVPAGYLGPGPQNYPTFGIPDGAGNWMETCPQLHNKVLREADDASGGKLKNVAKLLKYWRGLRTTALALNSFHLEMLLATEGLCNGAKTYAQCVAEALRLLSTRGCRALRDPWHVAGHIPAVATEAKRLLLNAAVSAAADRAARAQEAAMRGQLAPAYLLWNSVFNGTLPRY